MDTAAMETYLSNPTAYVPRPLVCGHSLDRFYYSNRISGTSDESSQFVEIEIWIGRFGKLSNVMVTLLGFIRWSVIEWFGIFFKKKGFISFEKLNSLFIDLFPSFSPSIIEYYLTDELNNSKLNESSEQFKTSSSIGMYSSSGKFSAFRDRL